MLWWLVRCYGSPAFRDELAPYSSRPSDLAAARPYLERALAVEEQVLGPDHPDTATSLSNLGGLLWGQGDLAGARLYYERALTIWQKRGDHYREGVVFFRLGWTAVGLAAWLREPGWSRSAT